MAIPKIIHQLWKDSSVPARYLPLVRSWKRHHPDWEYRLWTDADIRALVATRYPDFLPVFDAYADPICRADAGRYLILESFGGLYADLDEECLRPLDALLKEQSFLIGIEPFSHMQNPKVTSRGVTKLLCPTVIASAPGHAFWAHVRAHLLQAKDSVEPLDATGPFLLTHAFETYQGADVTLAPPALFYPFSKEDCWQSRIFDPEFWSNATREAYAIHYWDGSWFRKTGRPLVAAPEKLRLNILRGSEPPAAPPAQTDIISCLYVPSGDAEAMRLAIENFRNQTYPRRELVVLLRPDQAHIAGELQRIGDLRFRILRFEDKRLSHAAMLRQALPHISGRFLCLWQEDALDDASRLDLQMRALASSGSAACLLPRVLNWMPGRRQLTISRERLWEETLLCERSLFPALSPGAPSDVEALRQRHGVVLLDLPRLYMRCLTRRNLKDTALLEQIWQNGTARFDGRAYISLVNELGKRVPVSALEQQLRLGAPQAAQRRPAGINIFGHFRTSVGLGVAAQATLLALREARIPHSVFDLDLLEQEGERLDPDFIAPFAINLIHTNPDLASKMLRRGLARGFSEKIFEGHYNIAAWAWESANTLPESWKASFSRFDEIWTPSDFATKALQGHSSTPVFTLPCQVTASPNANLTRAQLGLPENRFLFLFMFDGLSSFSRKNPLGLIEAYKRAFPDESEATGLVLKIRSIDEDKLALLKAAAENRPSIQIRVGEMSTAENASLIAQCDCYVSLHRSEGFGLTMAEAMALGKPVIATAYSGNMDFMDEDTAWLVPFTLITLGEGDPNYPAGTQWADPDLDAAAQAMRDIADTPDQARAKAARAAAHIATHLSAGRTGAIVKERFDAIRKSSAALLPLLPAAPPQRKVETFEPASVLVLTPMKNTARYLPRYFEMLEALDYPASRLSLGILESDSDDGTYEALQTRLPALRQRLRRVEFIKQDFSFRLEGPRWSKHVQRRRREMIARSRNELLRRTLQDEDYVLWLDADLVNYPSSLLKDLMATEKDIVVPCCVLPDGRDFDLNSFRFDPAKGPAEDPSFLVDGLYQPPRGLGRTYLSELSGSGPSRIDAVGGTALLIRADLHREGLIFPDYSHKGYIETEGLAVLAKDMGYESWALPDLRITHTAQ